MLIEGGSKEKKTYGTWPSPISKELVTGDSITIQDVVVNETTGQIFHLENRPSEGGRGFLVEHTKGGPRDVLPKGHEYDVRSSVNGYGGAEFTTDLKSAVVFTDSKTRGVYAVDSNIGHIVTIAPGQEGISYAGFDVHPKGGWLILAIVEEKRDSETLNALVVFDVYNGKTLPVTSGADFYSNVHWNPSGTAICWTEWSLRDMPWTGTELYVATLSHGNDEHRLFDKPTYIAGHSRKESISQPRWGPDGSLFFASDRSGYWKLYQVPARVSEASELTFEGWDEGEKAEFSIPEWQLGLCTYVPLTATTLLAKYTLAASDALVLLDLQKRTHRLLDSPYTHISALRRISDTHFALIASTSTSPQALCELSTTDPTYRRTLAVSSTPNIPTTYFSLPEKIVFPRKDSTSAYAWLFPPQNLAFSGPDGALPPLLVNCHGGPTSHRSPGLDLDAQYWTSRGFAYAELNYAGSSGYGRAYRELLYGQWGVRDVEDAALFASYMTSGPNARADATRVGIVGGSAGGYAVLASLAANLFPWAGGISLYGVGNLKLLEAHTHKFESGYVELMVLPSPGDGHGKVGQGEKEKIYRKRSPAFHAEKMRETPVMLLQGAEDTVVPPEQAEEMARAIRGVGGTVCFPEPFAGEGHGFRKRETLLKVVEFQEGWWLKHLVRVPGEE